MAETLWWILSVALMGLGLAGTVLPALPGTAFILAGIYVGAWIDDFTRVGPLMLGVITALAVLAWGLDYVAGLLGAKRAGASRWALVGAALGTVVGLLMGLVGVLFMPLVGAALGEYWARRQEPQGTSAGSLPNPGAPPTHLAAHQQALRVGVATWLGIMAGMLAKVVLGFTMIGLFVVALLV